jgi:tight adherence protein B
MTWILLWNAIFIVLIIWVILYQKKYRLALRDTKSALKENKLLNGYLSWLNPYLLLEKAKKNNWNIDLRKYWIIVAISSVAAFAFLYIIFQVFLLMPLGILAGFAVPNVMLFYKKRKRKDKLLSEIGSYINSLANLFSTYGNVYQALIQVRELIDEPIRSDVDNVILKLENNLSLKEAFEEFNEKYNNVLLKLFHDTLVLIDENGGQMDDVLIKLARNYDEAMIRRNERRVAKTPKRKSFYALMKYLIAIPILFMTFSFEYYENFVLSIPGKIMFLLIIGVGIFSAYSIEKIYDKDNMTISG